MLRAFASACLFLIAAIAVLAYVLNAPYWLRPPQEKFALAWRQDLSHLDKEHKLPEAWKSLKNVEFTSNDEQVIDWYQKTGNPLPVSENGHFKLQVLGVHFIEGNRYGVMLQYNLVDLKSGNTVGEFSRRLKLGLMY